MVARALTGHHGRSDGDTETFIPDVAFCLKSEAGRNESGSHVGQGWNTNYIAHTLRGDGFDASEDGTGRGTPLVTTAYQCHGTNVGEMGTLRKGDGGTTSGVPFIVNAAESCATQSHARRSHVARCIDSTGSFANAQGGTVVAQPYNIIGLGQEGKNHAYPTEVSGCLQHKGLSASGNEAGTLIASSAVRRLTPRECERLQGFPDDFTLIPVKPVPAKSQAKARHRCEAGDRRFADLGGVMHVMAADGPRYKTIGNSMAVPVMRWIGQRIMESA